MGINARLAYSLLFLGTLLMPPGAARASDHDDGEHALKSRELNLTDLYVFREDSQDIAGSPGNLILVMNSNPRSVARQQYYFSTAAEYQFHISRVARKTARPTGEDDVTLSFTFSNPDASGWQEIRLNGRSVGQTTSLADMNAGNLTLNDA